MESIEVASTVRPVCPNCGTTVAGRFCSECGQPSHDRLKIPLRRFIGEVVEEAVGLDSRFVRTFVPLLLRPGQVSADTLAGRLARYSSALRVYLAASVLFFAVSALHSGASAKGLTRNSAVEFSWGRRGPEVKSEELQPALEAVEAKLRTEDGWFRTTLADRIHSLRQLPPGEAKRRIQADMAEVLPRVAFVLVPAFAGLLVLFFAGQGRYYAEHLVVALHQHAVGFVVLVPLLFVGSSVATPTGVGIIGFHTLFALRRVYGRRWRDTAWRLGLVGVGYVIVLLISLAVAGFLALYLLPSGS